MKLALEPLAREAASVLALAAAGDVALSEHELAAVGERAGGNPLFVRELVAAGEEIYEVRVVASSLEDVYLEVVD